MTSASVSGASMLFFPAAVFSAGMLMLMMLTAYVRIKAERSFQVFRNRIVRAAADTAQKSDPRIRQRRLRACSDAAADQYVHLRPGKKPRQSSMTLPVCIDNLLLYDRSVFNVIQFKLRRMSEMLEHISILVSYCNPHFTCSFHPHGPLRDRAVFPPAIPVTMKNIIIYLSRKGNTGETKTPLFSLIP